MLLRTASLARGLYNSIGVPIAAFGLLNPIIASAAMALSSLSVIVNSSLLRRLK